jgi:hypothetical protein
MQIKIVWIDGKPYVEDDRAWNGLRELTPYKKEVLLGYVD